MTDYLYQGGLAIDASGVPVPNATFVLKSDAGATAVLKDMNGTTITQVVTGANGVYGPFKAVDVTRGYFDNGTIQLPILSTAAQDPATSAAAAATSATTAAGSATDAANAVSGLATNIANAVDNGLTNISERVKVIEDGIEDGTIGGTNASDVRVFEWRFNAANLTAGAQGDPYVISYAGESGTILQGPTIKQDAAGTTPTTCDVQINAAPGGVFSSTYTGTVATLPAGQTRAVGALPQTVAIAAGAEIAVTLPVVPPPPVAATTAASVPVSNKTNDGSTSNQVNLAVTIPAGTTGDTVLEFIQTNYDIDASKGLPSSAWSTIAANKSTDATTGGAGSHLAGQINQAPWSSTLANQFFFKKTDGSNSTTPAVTVGLILRGGQVASVAWGATAESSGTAATTPVTTVGAVACDLVIYGFFARVNKVDADNGTMAFTGAATTIDQLVRTNRGATQAEQLLAVKAVALNPATTGAPGASIPTVTGTISSATITATGAAASTANTSWLPFVILVKRTPGTTGPTVVSVSIPVRIG